MTHENGERPPYGRDREGRLRLSARPPWVREEPSGRALVDVGLAARMGVPMAREGGALKVRLR